MRVLLLSAYHAPSHAYWAQSLQSAFPDWYWQVISLPARYFNWRIRGNALHIANQYKALLAQPYDLILATSMTDLTGLRSFCPWLASIPSVLYFHENQFFYPANEAQAARVEPQMMTLFSAHSATWLVFNSAFNRDTFFSGATQLLKKLPDCVPPNLLHNLKDKSSVLPVPIADTMFDLELMRGADSAKATFIWNHRWEHDKAPERLLIAVTHVLKTHQNFTLHVVGQQFRQQPACFSALHKLLSETETLGAWGFQATREVYEALLVASDAVISTALHDFQGIAVLEAVAAGCRPLVPNRLAYKEWFPEFGYDSHQADAELEALALAKAMIDVIEQGNRQVSADIRSMALSALAPRYEQLLIKVASL